MKALPWLLLMTLVGLPGTLTAASYRFDDAHLLGRAGAMPDWAATLRREAQQAPALTRCLKHPEDCPSHFRGLRHVLTRAAALPRDQQIKLINRYVNRRRYRDDRTRNLTTTLSEAPLKYRSGWSTVDEFMRRGGDCEDYATTKYFLLRRLGIAAEQLRVVVAYDRRERSHHAVVAMHDEDGEVWLLDSDNRIFRGRGAGYRYIYSLNEDFIWDHEAKRSVSRQTHDDRRRLL